MSIFCLLFVVAIVLADSETTPATNLPAPAITRQIPALPPRAIRLTPNAVSQGKIMHHTRTTNVRNVSITNRQSGLPTVGRSFYSGTATNQKPAPSHKVSTSGEQASRIRLQAPAVVSRARAVIPQRSAPSNMASVALPITSSQLPGVMSQRSAFNYQTVAVMPQADTISQISNDQAFLDVMSAPEHLDVFPLSARFGSAQMYGAIAPTFPSSMSSRLAQQPLLSNIHGMSNDDSSLISGPVQLMQTAIDSSVPSAPSTGRLMCGCTFCHNYTLDLI